MVEPDPLAHDTCVDQHVACRRCGFDLHSTPRNAMCPECGTRVMASLRGYLLTHASPAWLNHVARGLVLIGITPLLIVGVVGVSALVSGPYAVLLSIPWRVALLLATMPAAVGVWWSTAPEPRDAIDAENQRRGHRRYRDAVRHARLTVCVIWVVVWIAFAFKLMGVHLTDQHRVVIIALMLGMWWGPVYLLLTFQWHLKALAHRLGRARLARITLWVMMLCAGVTFFLPMILYAWVNNASGKFDLLRFLGMIATLLILMAPPALLAMAYARHLHATARASLALSPSDQSDTLAA